MPYEKKSYKKFNGKGKTTLNPEPLTLNRKRGKLAPLMTEEAKATASIHELSSSTSLRMQNTKNTYSQNSCIEVELR